LVGEPCAGVLRREDGMVVVRSTYINVDPEKVRRVVEEDRQLITEARRKDHHIHFHQTSKKVRSQESLRSMIVERFSTRR
jgi:hypothetical protein